MITTIHHRQQQRMEILEILEIRMYQHPAQRTDLLVELRGRVLQLILELEVLQLILLRRKVQRKKNKKILKQILCQKVHQSLIIVVLVARLVIKRFRFLLEHWFWRLLCGKIVRVLSMIESMYVEGKATPFAEMGLILPPY